jgi:hypothetical protein
MSVGYGFGRKGNLAVSAVSASLDIMLGGRTSLRGRKTHPQAQFTTSTRCQLPHRFSAALQIEWAFKQQALVASLGSIREVLVTLSSTESWESLMRLFGLFQTMDGLKVGLLPRISSPRTRNRQYIQSFNVQKPRRDMTKLF